MTAIPQLRNDGSLRHLLTLEGLPRVLIERLLERAVHWSRPLGATAARGTALAGRTVAVMFAEPSTRTRVSFELAARRIGAEVADGPQSVIRDQVRNGVAVRMAVLEAVLGS